MRRTTSSEDARVELMSLTDKACKEIVNLQKMQDPLKNLIFSKFDEKALSSCHENLSVLCDRLQRTEKRLAAEL
jgi:DNA-binding MarR family transcriptional regulator